MRKGGRGKGRWRWRRRRRRRTSVLEFQIQACKKPMPGKTWYVGTREVRWLHTLKDKVYMVSPETSIYKDLLISIAFPRFPLNPPFSSFFFFFFLVNLQNRLNIQQYHNIRCPPKMRITLFMLATLFHLALCQGPGPPAPPGGGDEPEPGSKCCSTVPRCDNNPDVSEDPT